MASDTIPRIRRTALVSFALCLTVVPLFAGCLPIPHKDVRQPAAVFTVLDSLGKPIPSAQVLLYSAIGEAVGATALVPLDGRGVGIVARESDWHVFLTRDEEDWTWAWCAVAPGYVRASGRFVVEPTDTIRVLLAAGTTSRTCVAEPAYLSQVAPR